MASADGSGVMRPSPQASPLGLDRFELDYLFSSQKITVFPLHCSKMRVRLTETCIVRMGSRFYNDNCVNYDRDRSQFLEFMPFLNIHRSDLKLLQRILAIYVQLVHILCDIRNLETRFGSIEWNNIKYISGLLFWGLHNSFTKTTFSVSRRSEKVADRRLSA